MRLAQRIAAFLTSRTIHVVELSPISGPGVAAAAAQTNAA